MGELVLFTNDKEYTKYPNGEKNRYELEFPYALILANRYDNPQACYVIYDLIMEMYDAYKIEMDSATMNFILFYNYVVCPSFKNTVSLIKHVLSG